MKAFKIFLVIIAFVGSVLFIQECNKQKSDLIFVTRVIDNHHQDAFYEVSDGQKVYYYKPESGSYEVGEQVYPKKKELKEKK
jgi:hypothetical protein